MDTMTVKTKWAKNLISEKIEKKLNEKLGTQLGISMEELSIKNSNDGDVSIYISVNISADRDELLGLFGNPFA